MKGIVSIERIAAARQRLAELSEFSNGTPGREMEVRQAVDMLSSVLGELEAVAKDSKPEQEAAHENESRFNILAETATDGIISIDDQSTIRYVNCRWANVWLRASRNARQKPYSSHARAFPADSSDLFEEVRGHGAKAHLLESR